MEAAKIIRTPSEETVRPAHRCTNLNKLPSELRLPLFFFSAEDDVSSSDLGGEGVEPSLLRPDNLNVLPSFPKDLSGDLNFKEPFPDSPLFPSLASFSSSSSSNGLRSLRPSPSRSEEPGDQRWALWSEGMLMLRLILRRINALLRVGPPPFRRWFLLTGMRKRRKRRREEQVGRTLWKNKKRMTRNNH